MAVYIILLTISLIIFGIYKYVNFRNELALEIDILLNIINEIDTKINRELNKRKKHTYYKELKSYYNNTIDKNSERIISKDNHKLLEDNYTKIDALYVDIKQNLRLLDKFEEFDSKFVNKKRMYRNCFNKSVNIVELLEDKYGNIIDKYLIDFNKDFNIYKENEINEINNFVKESRKSYKSFNVEKLKNNYNNAVNLDVELDIKIEEPHRLRDKFLKAEDNIDQLENELSNTQGNLYFKVFNYIKNSNDVSKEDMNEWNRIKRGINNFKKSRLLKTDVIELSEKLNKIIKDLSNLNLRITANVNNVTNTQSKINNN